MINLGVVQLLLLFSFTASVWSQLCPDDDPTLIPWAPASDEFHDEIIDGEGRLLTQTTTLRSITILNGGRLVIADSGIPIKLRVKYIFLYADGEFHVGSPECPYSSSLEIALFGRSDDTDIPSNPFFGRKFIGIQATGTIVIHGLEKLAWTFLDSTVIAGSTNPVVTLADDASSWLPGDRVIVASSDYDASHAEEFTLAGCSSCAANEVQLSGTVQYTHLGQVSAEQVDVRSEVGILTRNIKIYGEMEPSCYGNNRCEFFDYDTFGGQTQVLVGVKRVHYYGIELYNMGQQVLGSYPIHFHRAGEVYGSIAQQLSIHNCFSRCVTLHSTNGVHVEDVVGYDTLGHCFFLEDGNEMDNTFVHNLGLLTKPGTLLPSDRNAEMCSGMLDSVFPGYQPDVDKECSGVSTFWIAHPNNTLIDNAAAGSEEHGFFFVFHRAPTGPSAGTLPPFHGERSHLLTFRGNRAHSNVVSGLLLDRGVKVDAASESDPAEFLALQDYARYTPHVDHDLLQPRSPALIESLTAFKNAYGIIARGGDVWIQQARLTDNDVGVQMRSDITLPPDAGAHQELADSIVVATSNANTEWQNRPYTSIGVELCEGAVLLRDNLFFEYRTVGVREAYALGFCRQQTGQISPSIDVALNTFDASSTRAYFGRAGGIWGTYDDDGDLTQIFHDSAGYVTGQVDTYVVRRDNLLMQKTDGSCVTDDAMNAAICNGVQYGQIFVNVSSKALDMTIVRDVPVPNFNLTLHGANRLDTVNYPDSTQYQPVVVVNENYRITWSGAAPSNVQLNPVNFPQFAYVRLALSFPPSASFSLRYVEWKQMADAITSQRPLTAGGSLAEVDADPNGFTYYWDQSAELIYVKLLNRYAVDGYNYCAAEGCQMIWIEAIQ